jgi:hypothetical protein
MDAFDERVLSVIKDGRSRVFTQLLNEVSFSYNTPRLHLERPVAQRFMVKEKSPSNRQGKPEFIYLGPPRIRQQTCRIREEVQRFSHGEERVSSWTFVRFNHNLSLEHPSLILQNTCANLSA